MKATLEKFFLSKYKDAALITRRRAKIYLYFVLVIALIMAFSTATMITMGFYPLFSIEALSRFMLLSLGIIGLFLLAGGVYYVAANTLVFGAIAATALQILTVDYTSESHLVLSIFIPTLFIITAGLLSTAPTVIIAGIATVVIGVTGVMNSEVLAPEAASRAAFVFTFIVMFITVQCYLILNNTKSAVSEINEKMEKNMQQHNLLTSLLENVKQLSDQLAASSTELSTTAMHFSDNAQHQASSVEEISASIEEVSAGIDSIAENSDGQNEAMVLLVQKMATFSKNILEMKQQVEAMLTRVEGIMGSAHEGNQNLENMKLSMGNIKHSSGEITGIINIINDIFDQINLLSLNAAIEAARAGEAGRGFAVVADEISKLAEQTSQSVQSIRNLVTTNEQEIEDGSVNVDRTVETISMIIEGVSGNFNAMKNIASNMDAQLAANDEINEEANRVKSKIEEIKTGTSEHKSAMEDIVTTIASINNLTQDNSAGAEQTYSSTEELASMAETLRGMVSVIDDD